MHIRDISRTCDSLYCAATRGELGGGLRGIDVEEVDAALVAVVGASDHHLRLPAAQRAAPPDAADLLRHGERRGGRRVLGHLPLATGPRTTGEDEGGEEGVRSIGRGRWALQ